MKYNGPMYPKIQKKVESVKLQVKQTWVGGNNFEVDHYDYIYVVDLDKGVCWCKKFELADIPCCHATVASIFFRKEIEHYVDY